MCPTYSGGLREQLPKWGICPAHARRKGRCVWGASNRRTPRLKDRRLDAGGRGDVRALLRQPGGFEGFVSVPVELPPGRLTIIDLHHQVVDVFDVKPACPPGGSDRDQNPGVSAQIDELAHLQAHVESLPPTRQGLPPPLRSAVRAHCEHGELSVLAHGREEAEVTLPKTSHQHVEVRADDVCPPSGDWTPPDEPAKCLAPRRRRVDSQANEG